VLIETLQESPVCPDSALGPYRREDYAQLPDEPRCELIYGRFYVTPSPTLWHQIVATFLLERLARFARETGGLALAAPLDTHLADHTVVQPDLLYISPARMGVARRWIEGAPDLAVEVLSPTTARKDRGEKLRAYAELGVAEYWIVDPDVRQIEFLVNRSGRFEVALALDGRYRSEALPGLALDLVDFWTEVDARSPR
jgi:Uma2 family endonuclease